MPPLCGNTRFSCVKFLCLKIGSSKIDKFHIWLYNYKKVESSSLVPYLHHPMQCEFVQCTASRIRWQRRRAAHFICDVVQHKMAEEESSSLMPPSARAGCDQRTSHNPPRRSDQWKGVGCFPQDFQASGRVLGVLGFVRSVLDDIRRH